MTSHKSCKLVARPAKGVRGSRWNSCRIKNGQPSVASLGRYAGAPTFSPLRKATGTRCNGLPGEARGVREPAMIHNPRTSTGEALHFLEEGMAYVRKEGSQMDAGSQRCP